VKNSFFLVIPEQKNDPQLLASFSEANLTKWINELPAANPGLTTRLFQEMLSELISLEMPVLRRLAALELLKSRFIVIEDYLRSKLILSGFPKGETERKVFNLLSLLEKQLTIGYWIVVRELSRKEVGWLQSKQIALSISRTVEGLSNIVINHYLMSLPIPNWIWIDLHSLYALAVKLGKATNKIADSGIFFGGRSVEDRYKQILLLSLAYPSGLMQNEFIPVYRFSEKLCEFVQIESKPVVGQEIQCGILMDEDLAPSFLPENRPSQSDAAMKFLNFLKLYKLGKQADRYYSKEAARFSSLEMRKNNDSDFRLSAELFDYLMQRWRGREPQGTALFDDRLDRYLAIGLESTHILQDSKISNKPRNLEILAETYSDRALSCTFNGKEGALSIGSLVSFRKTTALPQQRSLGVICKILLPKQDDKLIFEITVIAAQSYAVTYQSPEASPEDEQKKALLYGLKNQDVERSFIIMESFMIKDGDILRMFMGQESFFIILMGRKNIGLGYWQFECRRILEDISPVLEKKKGYDFI
jgi:cyclic-di-GMP-binding protein